MASLDTQVAHLYRRLGFGGTRAEIDAGVAMGTDALIDSLLVRPPVKFDAAGFPGPSASMDANAMRVLELMAFGPVAAGATTTSPLYNPLHERVSWILQGLVVVGMADSVYLPDMLDHIKVLRGAYSSTYRQLLQTISTRPGMLKYLTGHTNTKAHPNQNYGRELLELFSLGRVDPATGASNYSQQDVVEVSRALSGWQYNWTTGATSFNAGLWDSGQKTFFGAPRGAANLDTVVAAVANHPAFLHYVPARFYKEITGFTADAATLNTLALHWTSTGKIGSLVKSIAKRKELRSDTALYNRTKTPVERVVAATRLLEWPGLSSNTSLPWLMNELAHHPFRPPNVSGWPKGDQWLNTTSLRVWCQLANMMAMRGFNWAGTATGPINPTVTKVHSNATAATAASYVLHLAGLEPASAKTVSALTDYAKGGTWTPGRAAGLLNLLLLSPEFLAN